MAKTKQSGQSERLSEFHRALSGLSRIGSELLPRDRLLHHVCAVVANVTHIKHVKVLRYRPDHGDLLLEAGIGWKPGVVGNETFALVLNEPAGQAMQTAMPTAIDDIRTDKSFRIPRLLLEHGIVSVLNVPVRIDGRMWGVLEVDSEQPRSFDDDDITFLSTAANILGIGLVRLEAEDKAANLAAEHARQLEFHEVVLREFKHRAKNNLQMIIAFLSLQQRHAPSQADTSILTATMNRIHAIALAQDQLSLNNDDHQVQFADYLHALCTNIDPNHEKITVELKVKGDVRLPLDRAVPVGLIVNELVTNAFKYAFDDAGGVIQVSFKVAAELAEGHLVVQDNGRGMGKPREGGLGLQLISALTRQIEGHFSREPTERGTRLCLRFPLEVAPTV
jgi:two-component sensor histidine kinase